MRIEGWGVSHAGFRFEFWGATKRVCFVFTPSLPCVCCPPQSGGIQCLWEGEGAEGGGVDIPNTCGCGRGVAVLCIGLAIPFAENLPVFSLTSPSFTASSSLVLGQPLPLYSLHIFYKLYALTMGERGPPIFSYSPVLCIYCLKGRAHPSSSPILLKTIPMNHNKTLCE